MTWRSALRAIVRQFVVGTGSDVETETRATKSDDEPSFREIEVVNWPATRTESLERTLDRAESVLEGYLTTLSDTDEKAIRTVRLEVILLGVVVSIAQITPRPIPVNVWTKTSGVLLVGSIIMGIFTYSTSPPDFGPGPKYVRSNIEAGEANDDVYLELLHGYDEAISHNREAVGDSSKYLFVVQALFIGSIVIGCIGIVFVS